MERDDLDDELLFQMLIRKISRLMYADFMSDANARPMGFNFPPEVFDCIKSLGEPSWETVRKAIGQNPEQATEDAMRLWADEASFEWPLDDPLRCLAIGVLRRYCQCAARVLEQKLAEAEDESEPADPADWWKSAD
jgi:hypothetical protein